MSTATLAPRTRRFEGAGVEIVADEAGPQDGRPVLLLHGGGQTRGAWGGALKEGARRGYRMISYDLRGHGESGWAEDGDYGVDAHAQDLARIVHQLDQAPAVVGASLGGMTGLSYAGEGGKLRALALVDIAPKMELAGVLRIQDFMQSAPDGFASLEEAADAVAGFLPHRPRPKDSSGLMKNLRLRDDGRLYWHWDPRMLTRVDDDDGLPNMDRLRDAARRLAVPALLLRGKMSDVVSLDGAKDFLELVPHAEFVDIAGADHMVAGDRNDAFNTAVFAFLDRHS
ncbi:alpha/beta hydrolase [Phenylobacterium sp. LjRoot219]|uniref:alpha/beta fold hydrolase n=1 Tax=Phenylobacterium sp. LjRoot219 TaxID=3342283 RepID=UPI003ECF1DE5